MKLNLDNLVITHHASEVMQERSVNAAHLMRTLQYPHVVEPHKGKRRFIGEHGLVVVVAGDDNEPVVVTVLMREGDTWSNDGAKAHFSAQTHVATRRDAFVDHGVSEVVPARRRTPALRVAPSPVSVSRTDPAVWAEALVRADGDAKRLQRLGETRVMVHNSPDWRKKGA